jgi:UDP-N-acetylglucosamine 2-epimerase (non-hydrolysing)
MSQAEPVVHIVGARPNFMKAAPVVAGLKELGVGQRLVHTGQHYDAALSDVFFSELSIPDPDYNLGVGSGSHAVQTGAIMTALELLFAELKPRVVVVYGDVNSTVAAALVAVKLHIPVAHVEAGLRSFDDSMPEEINRRVTDLLSELLFVTAPEGLINLAAVGIPESSIHFVGNPMIDTLLSSLGRLDPEGAARRHGLSGSYAIATIHRPSNVDDPDAAARVVRMLAAMSEQITVVLPLHPRGRANLARQGLQSTASLRVVDPLPYLEFMSLVRGSKLVVTDSGGIQEETTYLGLPCLTVRRNTERPVTITHGTNRLVEPDDVPAAVQQIVSGDWTRPAQPPPLWDGHAGSRIASVLAMA